MFNNFDSSTFLKHYWQQHPLLIRQAIVDFVPPIDADHLAGLAMEPDIESRMVSFDGVDWCAEKGPFTAEAFERNDVWTLLLQGLDSVIPEVSALRRAVAFVPSWRFDDVMVSYAVDGGSVGPHFDRYDVFLLQGEGRREWRIGQSCDHTTPTTDHGGLQLLDNFEPRQTHILETGDVLYIPPGVAHWGIAQGPCTTFSLGFRAPPLTALTARLADHVLERLNEHLLLEDQDSIVRSTIRSGEITRSQLENARSAVINALQHLDDGIWLGELLTEFGHPEVEMDPGALLPTRVGLALASRLNWMQAESGLIAFANGQCHQTSRHARDALTALCGGETVLTTTLPPTVMSLFDWLWHEGVLSDMENEQL